MIKLFSALQIISDLGWSCYSHYFMAKMSVCFSLRCSYWNTGFWHDCCQQMIQEEPSFLTLLPDSIPRSAFIHQTGRHISLLLTHSPLICLSVCLSPSLFPCRNTKAQCWLCLATCPLTEGSKYGSSFLKQQAAII